MTWSRRSLLSRAWVPLLAASPLLLAPRAAADSAQYLYDPLGRLVRVTLSDGTVIVYDYDAAGNRIRQVRGDLSPFNRTLQITGPVNLRTVADMAGYTGLTDATITFEVGSGVTVMGAPGGGDGIDTGIWPSGAHAIALTLQVSGKVYGGGGGGGGGGGDAIYCRENLSVVVNPGGQVKGAGGGGGMGGGWSASWRDSETGQWSETEYYGGGGGGGGFPNGPGGAEGVGMGGTEPGAAGTTSGGGAGGAGKSAVRTYGAGGAGGGAAASGSAGVNASGTGGCSNLVCWYGPGSGGAGGQPGYAIRKNGKTVIVTNNGTIMGAQG